METGESLTAPERVRRFETALRAKAKESPGFRFYSLCDKVWRAEALTVAWQEVRRNGGAAGVDGQTVADIEAYGVDRWLGETGGGEDPMLPGARGAGRVPRLPGWTQLPPENGPGLHRDDMGLTRLALRTASLPWAKA